MSEENITVGASGGFSLEGRTVDSGRPIEWVKRGWAIFLKNPGIWIASVVIAGVLMIVLSLIPVLGQLAANFLSILFAAGLLLGCKSLVEGGELRIDHLFAGFKQNTGNLVMLGVFYMVGLIIIVGVTFLIAGGGVFSAALMGDTAGAGMAVGGIVLAALAALVALALFAPLAMAIWFAPPLVMFRNVAPLEAMKASFGVCMKNLMPFLVYGIILMVLVVLAAIPFGLGFLVLMPVLIGAQYASYVDLFE